MEYGSRIRFVIITIVAVVLLVLSTWGVIALARNIFGGSNKAKTATSSQKIELSDYDRAGTVVKLNVDGPIVGDGQYVSYQIEVSQNYRKITTYKGYEKTVVSEKLYDNNVEAYRTFLRALERQNYTTKVSGSSDDEVAACATGRRFVYSLTDQEETVSRLWNTSCTSKVGSMVSSTGTSVRSLYKSQIPDYNTILVKEYSILK